MGWELGWSSSQDKVGLLPWRKRDVDMGRVFRTPNTGSDDDSAPSQVERKNWAHDLNQNLMEKDFK